jgi:NADH-quinone oxidoreductase subunit L
MLIPLGVLTLGAVLAGQIFHNVFVDAEQGAEFWRSAMAFDAHLAHAAHEVNVWVRYTPLTVMLIGLFFAYRNYIRHPAAPAEFVRQFPSIHRFLLNKWYFDELYDRIFVRPSLWLGRLFWHRGDEQTIDRFGPHGAAVAVGIGNRVSARLQSGYLYSYALVMLLGLIGAASWAFWWAGQ